MFLKDCFHCTEWNLRFKSMLKMACSGNSELYWKNFYSKSISLCSLDSERPIRILQDSCNKYQNSASPTHFFRKEQNRCQ